MKSRRDKKAQRNAVAHGIWGVSDSYNDALIHMELEDVLKWNSVLPAKGGYHVGEPSYEDLIRNESVYRVYKETDFKKIEAEIHKLLACLSKIGLEVRDHLAKT
jgi:hypothetical protein